MCPGGVCLEGQNSFFKSLPFKTRKYYPRRLVDFLVEVQDNPTGPGIFLIEYLEGFSKRTRIFSSRTLEGLLLLA